MTGQVHVYVRAWLLQKPGPERATLGTGTRQKDLELLMEVGF